MASGQRFVQIFLCTPAFPYFLEKDQKLVRWLFLIWNVSVYGEVGSIHAHGSIGLVQLDLVEKVEWMDSAEEDDEA